MLTCQYTTQIWLNRKAAFNMEINMAGKLHMAKGDRHRLCTKTYEHNSHYIGIYGKSGAIESLGTHISQHIPRWTGFSFRMMKIRKTLALIAQMEESTPT